MQTQRNRSKALYSRCPCLPDWTFTDYRADVAQILLRDTDAVVLHGEKGVVGAGGEGHVDKAVFAVIFDGVLH